MRKSGFTVIWAPDDAPARRAVLTSRLTMGIILSMAALAVAFGVSSLHYFYMWNRTEDIEALKEEVERLRADNASIRSDARRLTDTLAFLETTAKKLEVMAGSAQERFVGVGGPATAGSVLDLENANPKHLKLKRPRNTALATFEKLQENYRQRGRLLSSVPSIPPIRGYLSGGFNWRTDPFSGRRSFHWGIDISSPRSKPVFATADGVVSKAGWYSEYGRMVSLSHGFGLVTSYGHLSKISVRPGQRVNRGDLVGLVGSSGRSTGDHLHYEIRLHGVALNPSKFMGP